MNWSLSKKRDYVDALEMALKGLAEFETSKKKTVLLRGERKPKKDRRRVQQKKRALSIACFGILEYASQEAIDVHIGELREFPDHNMALVCISNLFELRKETNWWRHRGQTARTINTFFSYISWLVSHDPDLHDADDRELLIAGWKIIRNEAK